MCKIQIDMVAPAQGEQPGLVRFIVVGDPQRINREAKFWGDAPWASALKHGDVGEAKFETVKGKPKKNGRGNFPDAQFLKSWNGVEAPPRRGAARASAGTAKSETEILAALAMKAWCGAEGLVIAGKLDLSKVKVHAAASYNELITLVVAGKGKLAA